MARGVLLALALTLPRIAGATSDEVFPFGAYDKADIQPAGPEWEAYYRKLVARMREFGLNTLLTVPYKNPRDATFVLDLLAANGMRAIFAAGNPLNPDWAYPGPGKPFDRVYRHPAVIAYKVGNEPKEAAEIATAQRQFMAIRRYYDKPIVIALVGEIMTGRDDDFASDAWRRLDADVKFARSYPIRRASNLVEWPRDKMASSFPDWCAYMERAHEKRPWWYVAQTFGKGREPVKASYWRFPTGAELDAMVHVALANGARGIIGFSLQKFDAERAPMRIMLLSEALEPEAARDGSVPISSYGAIAKLTREHATLLLRHERGDFAATPDNAAVVAVPRHDPVSKARYVYVVNIDGEREQAATISLSATGDVGRVRNVYGDGQCSAASGSLLRCTLAPGEGRFLELLN